jgi:hypothetical protein
MEVNSYVKLTVRVEYGGFECNSHSHFSIGQTCSPTTLVILTYFVNAFVVVVARWVRAY